MKWLHGSEKRIKSKKENDCHAAFGGCGQFFLHRHAFVRNKKYKDSGGTDMYEKEVEQLQNIIDDSKKNRILRRSRGFYREQYSGFPKCGRVISTKSINIRRSRS